MARLVMVLDPKDGSYMPSKIRISAGQSFSNLKELKTVSVSLSGDSTEVLLLQDVKEVRNSGPCLP